MFRLSTLRLALITGFAALGSACTTLPSFKEAEYVAALDGASVVENKTRYSQALECLKPIIGGNAPTAKRFAVGRVNDFTGKEDLTNGKRMTQGAALMVISALAKTGVPIVERFDTSISDMELKYSDNKLITDEPNSSSHRKIFSGSLPGSDYHIVGGITEVNYNIRSGSLESSIRFIGAAARYFVMNVAVDLRVVNTKTLEVINTQSLQKQIIGTELSGGYFRLFTDGLVDINAAERTQEPIQKAVRMVIEQAVFNMVTDINNMPGGGACANRIAAAKTTTATAPATTAVAQQPAVLQPVVTTTQPAVAQPVVAVPTPVQAPSSAVASTSSKKENVLLDPYNNTSTVTAAPQQNEVGNLNGLFGAKTTDTNSPADQPETARASNREMQEKLLWGSRPMIR